MIVSSLLVATHGTFKTANFAECFVECNRAALASQNASVMPCAVIGSLTTRRVGLTEAGRVYLERCLECLHALDDADDSMRELAKAPAGLLRVTAPIDFGHNIVPVLIDVMAAYPNMVIDLRLSNRVMDMVEEGIDVAIRVARSLEGQFVARPFARARLGGTKQCTLRA